VNFVLAKQEICVNFFAMWDRLGSKVIVSKVRLFYFKQILSYFIIYEFHVVLQAKFSVIFEFLKCCNRKFILV